MEQTYRDQYAHYINAGSAESKDWKIEGYGVESLSLDYNPQISQYKTILARNADAVFDGYQVQSSISDKRIYNGDAIYEYVNEARKNGKAIVTELLEVDMTKKDSLGSYEALLYECLIVVTSFLGENAVIGYDIYIKGDWKKGTVTIAEGKPTFTESATTD